jgi:predicted outer membrane protein
MRTAVLYAVAATTVAGFAVSPSRAADTKTPPAAKEDAHEERSENRDFLKKAHEAGLAEVEFGRLAREQASNAEVKKFASMMVIDHQKVNEEIESLADTRHVTLAGSSATTHLSDLTPTSASNGYGDYAKDKSNGEQMPDDGKTLTLNGETFKEGLGVHAPSTLEYTLDAKYTRFQAKVGVDDEIAAGGSVRFQVFLDDAKTPAFDTGKAPMFAGSKTETADVDVTGKKTLKLVVLDNGDGITFDHADWADAKLLAVTSSTVKLSDADDLKRDKLAKLKGAEFDKQYMASQVDMHNEAVKLFQAAEKSSSDAKIDQFVKKTLPTLQEHLTKAQALVKELK